MATRNKRATHVNGIRTVSWEVLNMDRCLKCGSTPAPYKNQLCDKCYVDIYGGALPAVPAAGLFTEAQLEELGLSPVTEVLQVGYTPNIILPATLGARWEETGK
jgi:hypothetical protein